MFVFGFLFWGLGLEAEDGGEEAEEKSDEGVGRHEQDDGADEVGEEGHELEFVGHEEGQEHAVHLFPPRGDWKARLRLGERNLGDLMFNDVLDGDMVEEFLGM